MPSSARKDIAAVATLVLCVLVLRGLLIGQAPFTDEGSYVAAAYLLWNYPDHSVPLIAALPHIHLYPALLSWLCALDGSRFLYFRIADAGAMALCAASLFLLVRRHAGVAAALPVCLVWVLCSNHPLFINAGFKNPYAPGFTCIFLALLVTGFWKSKHRFLLPGALLGLACLFREPLVVFLVPVLVYAYLQGRARAGLEILLGWGFCLLLGISLIHRLQGGHGLPPVQAMLQNYRQLAAVYGGMAAESGVGVAAHGLAELRQTLDVMAWAVPLWLLGIASCAHCYWAVPAQRAHILAVSVLAAAPLPEFVVKLGFAYHLSATFAGLSLLAAIGLLHLRQVSRRAATALVVLLLPIIALVPGPNGHNSLINWYNGVRNGYGNTRYYGPVMIANDWSSPAAQNSFYLAAAARIRQHSAPADRILVSGFYTGLYPLSNRLPASLQLTDLTTYVMGHNLRLGPEQQDLLNRLRPRLFVETNRFPSIDLKTYVDRFAERFRLVDSVATGTGSYGQFACRIWEADDSGPP